MARGDVVSDIQDIATGANLDFQPSAGVEVMITDIGSEEWAGTTPDGTPFVDVFLIDGSLNLCKFLDNAAAARRWVGSSKLFLNNTHYLRIKNSSGATRQLGYTGIQTK